MSKANLKFDDDLEQILNEVENFEIEPGAEDGHGSVNVDDLLKEDEEVVVEKPTVLPDYGDPLNITELPVKVQEKIKLKDSVDHPFELLEKHEKDISAKMGGHNNLDRKFLVTNHEKTMDKKFPNVAYDVLETISNHCFPDTENGLPIYESEYWGTPKCLAMLPDKYLAFGTSNGMALVYHFADSMIKKFGGAKEQAYGGVTALDLSLKEEAMVCGYESGHIVLWGIPRNEQLKTVVPNSAECSPVLSIKFWRDVRNSVIASNSRGLVCLYKFEYSFFQWTVEKKLLIDKSNSDNKNDSSAPADPFPNLPNGFISIQVLRRDLTRHHPLNKYTVVAIASMKMVSIITLEPVVSAVYKYSRPSGLSDLTIPSISWGKGSLPGQDDNRHPILAVSWGNEICLLQCQNVEEEEGKGIKLGGYYYSHHEIYHVDWISEGNLLVYDYGREFKILNSGLFNKDSTKSKEGDFNYSAAIISSQPLDPDIGFQVYSHDLTKGPRQQRPILYYTHTIVANQAARSVLILGYKKIYIGRHFEWNEHIQEFVKKGEWLSAFALFVSFSKGTNRMFAGLPTVAQERRDLLKQYGAELVRGYITHIHDKHGPPEITSIDKVWKDVALIVIDFLVSIENYSFLFRETKRLFENFGLQDMFMEGVEVFIFRNRIKYIPNEPFREVVKYYSERDKISVLQYLMISIEMHDIDIDFAITLCMEYNLLTALFYLCSHKEGAGGADFITPISRALSIYQGGNEDENAEQREYGIKSLWFIHMIFQGKLFPQGTIPEKIWPDKVKDIIVLIFDETNLELMIRIEPHVAFEIFKTLFEPKLAELIQSYDESSMKLIGDFTELRSRGSLAGNSEMKYAADQFTTSVSNKIQAQMLALIYYCGKKKRDEKYRNLTYYFMAELAVLLDYSIPDAVMEESLFYILDNKREQPKWEIARKKLQEKEGEEPEIDEYAEKRNDLVLGLIKKLEGKIQEEELETIHKKINETEFLDVKAYLIALEGNYKECFSLYLYQTFDLKKKKIFNWLNDIITHVKSKQTDKIKALKSAIMSEFRELVTIDSERARQIILKLDPSLEVEAVNILGGSPRLQLNYLKGILENKSQGNNVPDELLVLHIKLMCQLYPKKVLDEIKKQAYPLEESLKICQEYNISNGVAFFLERAGNLIEALDIALDLFQKAIEKKLKKIEDIGLFHEASLTQKLENAKEICLRHSKLGDKESEKLWFRSLDKVIQGYLSYVVRNKKIQETIKNGLSTPEGDCYDRFVRVYNDYVSEMFASIAQNVLVENVAIKLQDYQNLTLAELREPLVIMLTAYFRDIMLVKDTRDLVLEDTVNNMDNLYYKKAKGVNTVGIDIDPDLVDKMVVFECGHSFPKNYLQNNKCLICVEQEPYKVESVVFSKEIQKLKLKGQDGSIEPSTAESASLSQESPREEIAREEPAGTMSPLGIPPQTHLEDYKEKYLRKLAIVDERKGDPAVLWEGFINDSNDLFEL